MGCGIDILVLGGTEGARKLNFGGSEEYKQFIEIGGRTIIEYVIDSALRCEDSRRVYVVTDAERLEEVLKQRPPVNAEKLRVIPQAGSIVQNIREAVALHALPDSGFPVFDYLNRSTSDYVYANPKARCLRMVGLYSDTVFIKPEDISRFVEESNPAADYEIGFADETALGTVEQTVGAKLCLPETKTALFPIAGTSIRHNNMVIGYPMRIPDEIWGLAQSIYDNRKFLTEQGLQNPEALRKIYKMLKEYTFSHGRGKLNILYGFLLAGMLMSAFKRAHKKGDQEARNMLKTEDFEMAACYISGNELYGEAHISDVAMPTFDIDNEKMLTRLTEEGGHLFRKLMGMERQYPPSPERELEMFVQQHDDMFNYDEPVPLQEWRFLLGEEAVPDEIMRVKIKRPAPRGLFRPFFMQRGEGDER
ncbi:NTP transferase domain-containing protein [Candidatus Woesearchaeota archaeon]|nr:NTP transferase domain-containing protein [Candidatus Woesearchaeota archaeon]